MGRKARIRIDPERAEARNMAGLTEKEIRDGLDGIKAGRLAGAACAGALAAIAIAWLFYVLAFRRPDLAAAAQPLGWASGAFGTAAAAAKLWR